MRNSGLMVAMVVVMGLVAMEVGLGQAQQCPSLDIGGLISNCQQYVEKSGPKIAPSEQCCGVVRNINLPCACKYVNKDVEKLVSVKKVVYVAQYCGLTLRHGFKCGNKLAYLITLLPFLICTYYFFRDLYSFGRDVFSNDPDIKRA